MPVGLSQSAPCGLAMCLNGYMNLTGDHAAIYPENSKELVNRVGELLNVNLDAIITLTNTDGEHKQR